ncbi:MAG: hypothetical protein AB1403_04940 [Candidatus Riflebacteria bacterium]
MIKFSALPRIFFCLIFLGVILALTGCGGGGGGSSTAGISPAELEVQAVLDSLVASIKAQSADSVMSNFDTNLKYYPAATAVVGGYEDYNQFRNRLNDFFTKAQVTDCSITSAGIDAGMESVAMARGVLSCTYNEAGTVKTLQEQIEMKLERVSKWGISEIYAYDQSVGQTGMNFPPKL